MHVALVAKHLISIIIIVIIVIMVGAITIIHPAIELHVCTRNSLLFTYIHAGECAHSVHRQWKLFLCCTCVIDVAMLNTYSTLVILTFLAHSLTLPIFLSHSLCVSLVCVSIVLVVLCFVFGRYNVYYLSPLAMVDIIYIYKTFFECVVIM